MYKTDALEQYGRKKNLQIHKISESANNNDDGENIAFQVAEILKIKLDVYNMQRAHCIGKEKRNKSHPVIVRFINYKKINLCSYNLDQRFPMRAVLPLGDVSII